MDKPVNKTIKKRYKDQRNRGTEGFGFYIPETNRLVLNTKESRIISLLKRDEAKEILFHHRFPTSTDNVRNACHPFSTKAVFENQYVGVHNGVIYNDDEVKKDHDELGIQYASMQPDGKKFNDSEALIYDLARYFEGQVDKLTARGNIAFIVVKRNPDGKAVNLLFGRNSGNPLVMKRTKNSLTVSSEGEGDTVEPNMLYCYDYETKSLTKEALTIPLGGYNYTGYGGGYQSEGKKTTGRWESYPKAKSHTAGKVYEDNSDDDKMTGVAQEILATEEVYDEYMQQAEYDYEVAASWLAYDIEQLEAQYQVASDAAEVEEDDFKLAQFIEELYATEEAIDNLKRALKKIEEEGKRRQPFGFHYTETRTPAASIGQRYSVPETTTGARKRTAIEGTVVKRQGSKVTKGDSR